MLTSRPSASGTGTRGGQRTLPSDAQRGQMPILSVAAGAQDCAQDLSPWHCPCTQGKLRLDSADQKLWWQAARCAGFHLQNGPTNTPTCHPTEKPFNALCGEKLPSTLPQPSAQLTAANATETQLKHLCFALSFFYYCTARPVPASSRHVAGNRSIVVSKHPWCHTGNNLLVQKSGVTAGITGQL